MIQSSRQPPQSQLQQTRPIESTIDQVTASQRASGSFSNLPSSTNANVQIDEKDRAAFLQKFLTCKDLLPRMERLIDIHGRLGTNPEVLRKYASLVSLHLFKEL